MAVDGTIGDIMDALEAALKFEGDDYTFTAAGQVLRGRYVRPPQLPFIALSNPQLRRVQGPPLGFREQRATVDIVAWGPSQGGTIHDRTLDSLALLHQVVLALDEARDDNTSALYGLREVEYETITLDSEVDGTPPGCCVAWLGLAFTFKTHRGL